MIDLNLLTIEGFDRWDRPVFRHLSTGRWYCCVDLNATLDDVKNGKAALYLKYDGREGEPDCSVSIHCTEPPAPEDYLIIQDGLFGEWTAIRDNWLGEIIASNCETREQAVIYALADKEQSS